jgi:hypothetical protein
MAENWTNETTQTQLARLWSADRDLQRKAFRTSSWKIGAAGIQQQSLLLAGLEGRHMFVLTSALWLGYTPVMLVVRISRSVLYLPRVASWAHRH